MNTHAYMCECGGLFSLHKDEEDEVTHEISLGEFVTPLLPLKIGKV